MRKVMAALLTTSVVLLATAPALADADPLQSLQNLMQQEQQSQMQGAVESSSAADANALLAPTTSEVEMDVDMEAGDTQDERVASYVAKLEAQAKAAVDFDTQARLGLAYQLQNRHDKALAALNKALAMAPGAQNLYDALAQSLAAQNPGLKVYVAGDPVTFDVQPVIVSGRTLVPIRFVVQKMGGTVAWNEATKTVTVTLGATTVEVVRDSTSGRVNGQPVTLDVPATIIDGRTMVPLRFVSESLNKKVDYHAASVQGTAVISIVENN